MVRFFVRWLTLAICMWLTILNLCAPPHLSAHYCSTITLLPSLCASECEIVLHTCTYQTRTIPSKTQVQCNNTNTLHHSKTPNYNPWLPYVCWPVYLHTHQTIPRIIKTIQHVICYSEKTQYIQAYPNKLLDTLHQIINDIATSCRVILL